MEDGAEALPNVEGVRELIAASGQHNSGTSVVLREFERDARPQHRKAPGKNQGQDGLETQNGGRDGGISSGTQRKHAFDDCADP